MHAVVVVCDAGRSGEEMSYPLQAVVRGAALHDKDQLAADAVPLATLFPPGAPCCLLTSNFYGCLGKVGAAMGVAMC